MRVSLMLVLAAFLAGVGRYALAQPTWTKADLAWYNDKGSVRMVGQIISPPDQREDTTIIRIQVSSLTVQAESGEARPVGVRGLLLARLPATDEWRYGDVLELEGEPSTPPAGELFSYRDYLARQGVYTYLVHPHTRILESGRGNPMLSAIYGLRERSYQVIQELFPQPESGLLAGILLGIESDLTPDIKDAFRETGTSHIIAISGFNIAILAALFTMMFNNLLPRRWMSFTATAAAIAGYTILVGAEAPVVRAAIMGGMSMLGRLIGRRQTGINTLGFVAAVMCLLQPTLIWDSSFQLTFSATLGMVLFVDRLQAGYERLASAILPTWLVHGIGRAVSDYLLVTVAAQITTLPVIAVHFHRLSSSLLPANLLILPAQPLVMVMGGIAVVGGFAAPIVGQVLAYLAWVPLAYTIRVVELAAEGLPGSIVLGAIHPGWIVLYYAMVLCIPLLRERLRKINKQVKISSAIIGVGLLAAVMWHEALTSSDGKLRLTLFNLPGGAAMLVQTPGDQYVLINGSTNTKVLQNVLDRRLPLFKHELNMLITTRNVSTLSSLSTISERYTIRTAMLSDHLAKSKARDDLLYRLMRENAQIERLETGQTINLGNGARLKVLVDNEDGSAVLCEWGNFRVLMPGGVALEELEASGEASKELSVLILTKEDVTRQVGRNWEALQPRLIIWGDDERLQDTPPNWLNSAGREWVRINTDGNEMRLTMSRLK